MGENRARIAAHLGVERLVSVHQVHGDRVEMVSGAWPGARPRADAMVTDRAGVGLAILTADCAPVLFASMALILLLAMIVVPIVEIAVFIELGGFWACGRPSGR